MHGEPVYSTDQATCYNESGAVIPCTGTGQDGETRSGASWPEPRFAVSGGIAEDLLTGLSWPIDANPAEFALSFREALEFVFRINKEGFLGFSDWRLPGRAELFSLVSHAEINPCLPASHPFRNVFAGYCWTDSALARLPDQAFTVHLGGGRVFPAMMHASCLVWPVRGPALKALASGPARFFPEEKWVKDRLTGLFWQLEPADSACLVSWNGALALAREFRGLGPAGRTPRLPNVRELFSLLSETDHSPAIVSGHPFKNVPEFCWSSTTSALETRYAWTTYLTDGRVGVGVKRQPGFSAWLCA